jgi:hypothetical protein
VLIGCRWCTFVDDMRTALSHPPPVQVSAAAATKQTFRSMKLGRRARIERSRLSRAERGYVASMRTSWASIVPNATCATALIDRVIHHADVISIEGKSYRLREAEDGKRRGID